MPPLPFSDFTGQFFWDFKRMDNVNYNFKIVELLYQARPQTSNSHYFNKPIIILLMAMIECMMYDFVIRIQTYSGDPFPNITSPIVIFFRGTRETDELKLLIARIKSQNLFRVPSGDTLYDDLDQLRKVRNRVHIQNRYQVLDKNEYTVFTETERKRAEKSFEKVCEVLCNVYPRWNKQPLPMTSFPRPW